MPAQLYALLIGINDYPDAPLHGCAADVAAMEAYLVAQPAWEGRLQLRKLLDREATKQAVADALVGHLGQAGEGDSVLLYFSGHGAQEVADPEVWEQEQDGCLEGIACRGLDGQIELMADKEIRYLLGQAFGREGAAPPHILTLFDCCHSGDNTRSSAQQGGGERAAKRLAGRLPQREWGQFLFGGAYAAADLKGEGLQREMPQVPHVHLAAALPDQAALEVNGQGVFTQSLLQVLSSAGDSPDYYTLHQMVRNYIRFKYPQDPQLDAPGGGSRLLYQGFLGLAPRLEGLAFGQMVYNTKKGWVLDKGEVHGLSEGKEVSIELMAGQGLPGSVLKAFAGYSILDIGFESRQQLDKKQGYRVRLGLKQEAPMKLWCPFPPLKEALSTLLDKAEGAALHFSATAEEADLALTGYNGRFFWSLAGAAPAYPAIGAPVLYDELQPAVLMAQARQVSKWQFTKSLYNPKPSVFQGQPLNVEIWQQAAGEWAALPPKGEVYPCTAAEEAPGGPLQARLKIRLSNPHPFQVYFTLLYLDSQYTASLSVEEPGRPGLLEQAATPLGPGQSIWLFGHRGGVIPFTFGEREQMLNLEESCSWFKLLVSATPDINYAHLLVPQRRMMDLTAGADWSDWATQLVAISVSSPAVAARVQPSLERWLEDGAWGDVVMARHFDATDWGAELSFRASARPAVALQRSSLLWGGALRIANAWAGARRKGRFKRQLEKYPSRTLIVSEGDSWFQHPALMDTIDHLSLYYNIYSKGAAGDSLRAYLQTGEWLEAFAEARALAKAAGSQEQPRFLLLSGGGNDILGPQFSVFLRDGGQAGNRPSQPGEWLNERFHAELHQVMALYRQVLLRLQLDEPGVAAVLHGYDYVRPLPHNAGGKSWLGRPMSEKGLLAEEERQAVARYLIDAFNQELEKVAAGAENAVWVDLRGAVQPWQWADEIHPNAEGYQMVAARISAAIDQIILTRP